MSTDKLTKIQYEILRSLGKLELPRCVDCGGKIEDPQRSKTGRCKPCSYFYANDRMAKAKLGLLNQRYREGCQFCRWQGLEC